MVNAACPEGTLAISRWLSEATPPGIVTKRDAPRQGCQRRSDRPHVLDYLSLHYHLVFSTRERTPLITAPLLPRLHDYLGGTVRGLGGFPQGIGGVADHVHLLVGLKATHCLADFMRELKKASSVWMHDEAPISDFAWQEGYAAFTVSATAREAVQRYIANQADHHRRRTFREELIALLQRAEVKYDEKYLD